MAKAVQARQQLSLFTLLLEPGAFMAPAVEEGSEKEPSVTVTELDRERDKKAREKIRFFGNAKERSQLEKLLSDCLFTGEEAKDRLLIQSKLDQNKVDVHKISYGGNTVYPSFKLVKEFQKMKQTGSIEKMTNGMYTFLHLNFDIAHYDKRGYIEYYDWKFENLYQECLKKGNYFIPSWKTDVAHIMELAGL